MVVTLPSQEEVGLESMRRVHAAAGAASVRSFAREQCLRFASVNQAGPLVVVNEAFLFRQTGNQPVLHQRFGFVEGGPGIPGFTGLAQADGFQHQLARSFGGGWLLLQGNIEALNGSFKTAEPQQ